MRNKKRLGVLAVVVLGWLTQGCTEAGVAIITDPIPKKPKKESTPPPTPVPPAPPAEPPTEPPTEPPAPPQGNGEVTVGDGEMSGGEYLGDKDSGSRRGFRELGTPGSLVVGSESFVMGGHCPYVAVVGRMNGGVIIPRPQFSGGLWLYNLEGQELHRVNPCWDEFSNVGSLGDQVIDIQEFGSQAITACEGCNFTGARVSTGLIYKSDQSIFYLSRYAVIRYKITGTGSSRRLQLVRRHIFVGTQGGVRFLKKVQSMIDIGNGLLVKSENKTFAFDYALNFLGEVEMPTLAWSNSTEILSIKEGNDLKLYSVGNFPDLNLSSIVGTSDWRHGQLLGVSKSQNTFAAFQGSELRVIENAGFGLVKSFSDIRVPALPSSGTTAPVPLSWSPVSNHSFRDDGMFYWKCRLFDLSGVQPKLVPLNLSSPMSPNGQLQDVQCGYYLGALHPSGHSIFVDASSNIGFGVYHYMITRQ